jgi:integrase
MASIKKRDDGRWRARYRDSAGKEHARHFVKKADGQAWLDRTTAALVRGDYADPKRGRQTFHDFAVEWAASQDWKATTRQSFPLVLARAETVLPKDVRLAQIDQLVIKRARVDLATKYSLSTVALTLTYVTSIMRAAHRTQRIPTDPTVGTMTQRRRNADADRVGPDDIPTRKEVAAIWAAAPSPFRAAIALGASGLRVGEVLGMTADRINLDGGLVTIDRQLQRIANEMQFTAPKGEKARTIRVPTAVAFELRRHLRCHERDGLLFRGLRGTPALRRDQFYKSAWHPALVGAGLDSRRYVFHSLRHFAASSMLAEGVNPMAVAGHLGDTLETLQRVYAHWMRDDRDVPADALDRIFVAPDENLADSPRISGLVEA